MYIFRKISTRNRIKQILIIICVRIKMCANKKLVFFKNNEKLKKKDLATGAALANPFFDSMEPQTLFDTTTSTTSSSLSSATINKVANVANNSTSINSNTHLFMTSSSQPTSQTSGELN